MSKSRKNMSFVIPFQKDMVGEPCKKCRCLYSFHDIMGSCDVVRHITEQKMPISCHCAKFTMMDMRKNMINVCKDSGSKGIVIYMTLIIYNDMMETNTRQRNPTHDGLKTCSHCKYEKTVEAFYSSKRGLSSYCKACMSKVYKQKHVKKSTIPHTQKKTVDLCHDIMAACERYDLGMEKRPDYTLYPQSKR